MLSTLVISFVFARYNFLFLANTKAMAKKRKIKSRNTNLVDDTIDALSNADFADGVWEMFSKTGEAGYYLLYKSLNDNGNIPK